MCGFNYLDIFFNPIPQFLKLSKYGLIANFFHVIKKLLIFLT